MLSLRNIVQFSFVFCLSLSASANAQLYGFSEGHPLTRSENMLNMSVPPVKIVNYRQEMRNNVEALASYAKKQNPEFIVITHGGEDVLYKSLWEYHLDGYNKARAVRVNAKDPSFLLTPIQNSSEIKKLMDEDKTPFAKSVDGIVLNNVICGDGKISDKIKNSHLQVISIDHCKSGDDFDAGVKYSLDKDILFYGFLSPNKAFKLVKDQPIIDENFRNAYTLKDATNIDIIIDDSLYETKEELVHDIAKSNFDVVIIRPLFHNKTPYTKEEIERLQFKRNGSRGRIIAMQNLSEAQDSEYFWKKDWTVGKPDFIARKSLVNKDGYIMKYWDKDWRKISSDYLKSIVDTGYDGVFLTGLENHLYFEKQTPLE